MFKKLSFIMLVIALAFIFACATPYVKDIAEIPTDAATVEVKAEEVSTPAARVIEVSKVAVVKGTVLFDFDSYEVDIVAKLVLEKIAEEMDAHPDTLLVLKGHTDKVGGLEYNQILSENRADAVEEYLVGAGVSADRIVSVLGFGKTLLIPELTDHENRRVIIMSVDDK